MDRVTGSTDSLFEQAPETAKSYLRSAIKEIDNAIEKGYAKKHPELIAAFMNVCATDFATACVSSALQEIREAIEGLE